MKKARDFIFLAAMTLAAAGSLPAQEYGARLGVQRAGDLSFEPRGPGVMFGALDPTVRRWYVPQELYLDYQWRQWEHTNYARDWYQRYVNTRIEGDYFYDTFGDFINYGWLIYDWRQDQPVNEGSGVLKDKRFTDWFGQVTVSGDSQGQYAYAITVGNAIRTTLTPMTFSKPRFNGVQADFVADKYAGTIIASRISDPTGGKAAELGRQTNTTSLIGGRGTAQIGDFITLGATLVDARNANTALDMFDGNFIAGNLTSGQSASPVTVMAVILSDDSPEDGEGGAALFGHDIRIVSRDFETLAEQTHTLAEVVRPGAEWPAVFGGFTREGFVSADGRERIVLNYDFTDPAYIGPDLTSIVDVEFEYLLANDYRIEIWSNKQTGRRGEDEVPQPPLTNAVITLLQPALLTVESAEGNVQDISNVQVVRFNYGLPTANLVGGFTIEGADVLGFDFYGEWDRSVRYTQYPNAALFQANEGHEVSSRSADAYLLTVSKQGYPFFAYGEVYFVDDDYSTSTFVSSTRGDFAYDTPSQVLYEFVADNDDQDRRADWRRRDSPGGDFDVFPGWDENNDFVSDFNQNDTPAVPNEIPDYEEPFLRHEVDRPEFLFGIDLNNNAYVDRFEDDELPDYPYKPDRNGYNVFAGAHLTPETRLFIGRIDEEKLSDNGINRGVYGLFTFDKDYPGLGRVRIFDMLKRVEDTIADDRRAPKPFRKAPRQAPVLDILPAPDTWVNTAWLGLDYAAIPDLRFSNKLKYEFYNQKKGAVDISGRSLHGVTSFFGLINKLDYQLSLGRLSVQPKLKSELLNQEAFSKDDDDREHWTGSATLLAQVPVMRNSVISAGVELTEFADRTADETIYDRADPRSAEQLAGLTGDFRSTFFAFQLSNRSHYLGYILTMQLGFRIGRISNELIRLDLQNDVFEKERQSDTETTSFITIYAGSSE